MSITYPYSDEYMVFDESTRRYILTDQCAIDRLGLDLASNVNDRNAANEQAALKRVFRQVSNAVYNYIHKFNVRTDLQDIIIAKVPSARSIIQEALEEQLLYMALKGDLSRSTDKEKRALAMDENTKAVLERVLPELGVCILYTGDLRKVTGCQY